MTVPAFIFASKNYNQERQNFSHLLSPSYRRRGITVFSLKARMRGKAVRRTLTDAIKLWYERNPNQTSKPEWLMYAETTNLIYQALWNVDALQLESKIGCKRNKSRDYLADSSLKELERAEANVCDVIDYDNIKPCDAVSVARIRNKLLLLKDI